LFSSLYSFLDRSFVAFFHSTSVIENVTQATFKVKLDEDNVAGVHLPIFKNYADISNLRTPPLLPLYAILPHPRQTAHLTSLRFPLSSPPLLRLRLHGGVRHRAAKELHGLGRGGQQVREARETYIKALDALVELASLQVPLPHCTAHSRSAAQWHMD
jgi:hypothetical protein